jgi:hypothetical protein
VAMRDIARRARRCPKALESRRSGPHGRSLWVIITAPWYNVMPHMFIITAALILAFMVACALG